MNYELLFRTNHILSSLQFRQFNMRMIFLSLLMVMLSILLNLLLEKWHHHSSSHSIHEQYTQCIHHWITSLLKPSSHLDPFFQNIHWMMRDHGNLFTWSSYLEWYTSISGWKSYSLGTTEEEEVLVPGTGSLVLVETLLSLCRLIDRITSITTDVEIGSVFVMDRIHLFLSLRVLLLLLYIMKSFNIMRKQLTMFLNLIPLLHLLVFFLFLYFSLLTNR